MLEILSPDDIDQNIDKSGFIELPYHENEQPEWNICIKDPFPNCSKIYPIQQKKVKKLVNSLKDDENIEKIIIFGSSVTNRCHTGSDVDIYLDLNEEKPVKREYYDFVYDLWTNFTVDKRLHNEIFKKGIVVYERLSVS